MDLPSNPKSIIEDIREEKLNLSDSFTRSLDLLATGLFTREGQFFYELIQNAEDCTEHGEESTVEVVLRSDGVVVRNDGQLFDEEDVRNVCDVGRTLKRETDENIGFWGIGFKSVFRVSETPYILSGQYRFQFSRDHWESDGIDSEPDEVPWRVTPLWVDDPPVENSEGWNTFYLPYLDEKSKQRVADGVENLQNHLLLFLDKITTIRVTDRRGKNEDKTREMVVEDRRDVCDGQLVELSNGEQWWVYEEVYDVPSDVSDDRITRERARDGIKSRPARVAIEVDDEGDLVHQTEGSVHASVFSFLPIEGVTSGMPFVIDADLLTGAGRTKPHQTAAWNEWMMRTIGSELVPSAMESLKDHEKWRYQFHDALIPSERPSSELFRLLYQSILDTVREHPIIPTDQGEWVKPEEAAHVVTDDWEITGAVHRTVDSEDIQILADRSLTHEEVQMKRRLYRDLLPIREFGVDQDEVAQSGRTLTELASDEIWMQARHEAESAEWFENLYELLVKGGSNKSEFSDVKCVYTPDGLYEPTEIYLSLPDRIESVVEQMDADTLFPTVPDQFRSNTDVRNFLNHIEVPTAEPDDVAEIIAEEPGRLSSLLHSDDPVSGFRELYGLLEDTDREDLDQKEIVYTGESLVSPTSGETEVFLPSDDDGLDQLFDAVGRSPEGFNTVPAELIDQDFSDGQSAMLFLRSLGLESLDSEWLAEQLQPKIVGTGADTLSPATLVTYTGIVARELEAESIEDIEGELRVATRDEGIRPASETVLSTKYGASYNTETLLDSPIVSSRYDEADFGEEWSEFFSSVGVGDGEKKKYLQAALDNLPDSNLNPVEVLPDIYTAVPARIWTRVDQEEIELFTQGDSFEPATKVYFPDKDSVSERFADHQFVWLPDGNQRDTSKNRLKKLGVEDASSAYKQGIEPGESIGDPVDESVESRIEKGWNDIRDGTEAIQSALGSIEWVDDIQRKHRLGMEVTSQEAERRSYLQTDQDDGSAKLYLARWFNHDWRDLAKSIASAFNLDSPPEAIQTAFHRTAEDAAVTRVVQYEEERRTTDQESPVVDVREDRSRHRGYDVLSRGTDEEERHIAIESLSADEYVRLDETQRNQSRRDDRFCLYIVVEPKSEDALIWTDENPQPRRLKEFGAHTQEVLTIPPDTWRKSCQGPFTTDTVEEGQE